MAAAAIRKFYRRTAYVPLTWMERRVRRLLSTFLPTRWNPFRLLRTPSHTCVLQGKVVIPAAKQYRSPPEYFLGLPHSNFKAFQVLENVSHFVSVKNGYALASAAHLTEKGALIGNYTEYFANLRSHPLFRIRRSRLNTPIRYVEGNVASLSADCHDNYYHWLFDVLPRLKLVKASQTKPDFFYLDQSKAFQRDSLSFFHIPKKQIILTEENPYIQAENLLLTSFPCMGPVPRWAIEYLREEICQKVEGCSPKRIYISRNDAKYRRVLNEEEIWPQLEAAGFVKVIPGEHSFKEQVALFKEAEIVMGPHGAGLANLVFCREGTRVIEIFPRGTPCICYWAISSLCHLNYAFLCSSHTPGTPEHPDAGFNQIIIDPHHLNTALRKWA